MKEFFADDVSSFSPKEFAGCGFPAAAERMTGQTLSLLSTMFTPHFWLQSAGRHLVTRQDVCQLSALHLVSANGALFIPSSPSEMLRWLLITQQPEERANMAQLLSAQLTAVSLGVYHDLLHDGQQFCLTSFRDNDLAALYGSSTIEVGEIRMAAKVSLAAFPYTPPGAPGRATQRCLKLILEAIGLRALPEPAC